MQRNHPLTQELDREKSLDFYREKESSKAQNYVSNMIYPLVI